MNVRASIEANNIAPYEDAGATLLSMQPVTDDGDMPSPDEDWPSIFTHLEGRLNALRSWRWSWWSTWAAIATFFLPRRYHWFVTANRMNKGQYLNDAILDSTGTLAMQTCAAGMWTGLTSPSRPWFKLGIGLPWIKPDKDAKDWLEDTTERINTVLHQSNFYSTMAQAFQDVTTFGTAPPIVYEDFEDVIRLYLPCAGEYFLGCGARLSVDVFNREFVLTVSQIVDMFGRANCPQEVQVLWDQGGGGLEREFVIAHSIEPNFAIQRRGGRGKEIKVVPGVFTYREVYWIRGGAFKRPLSVKGFNTKPFAALRWSTVSNDPYGRGPCQDALGDNKQVQVETRRKGEFIEKGVRPPMLADPSMKNEPASINPGHITYTNTADGKGGFRPAFQVDHGWLAPLQGDIEKVAARIERCLFVDVFMAISRMEGVQPRNELELTKRDLERLQVLGPVVELAEPELSLIISRVMDIMTRRKMLKPRPPSLQAIPLKINYTSIMKLAQRAAKSIAMKDGFAVMGQLSSAAKAAQVPDPIRTINLDKALADYLETVDFPADAQFTEMEVQEHDAARQQAKAQAQAPAASMAAVSAAKTLSDTKIGGGSALNSLLTGNTTPS